MNYCASVGKLFFLLPFSKESPVPVNHTMVVHIALVYNKHMEMIFETYDWNLSPFLEGGRVLFLSVV